MMRRQVIPLAKEFPMPTRTAQTAWHGSLKEGSGRVELVSSGLGGYDVSWPKRTADDADGATSPEELIAAAHSACYAMSLSALVAGAGGDPRALDVRADVSIGPAPTGGAGSERRTRAIPIADARNDTPSRATATGVPSSCTRTPHTPGPTTSVAALLVAGLHEASA